MIAVRFFVLVALPIGGLCVLSRSNEHIAAAANPIRRVVTLLQKMQAKVAEDGKAEEELYEKFACYCKNGEADLTASIAAAESKSQQDTSSLDEAEAEKAQLGSDLTGHQADRVDAKDAVAKATALRSTEAGVFAKDSSDYKTNLAALGKAIAAVEGGAGGSFLQTSAAAKLRQLIITMDMSSVDRNDLAAFLSAGQGYAPQSGEITGILKQMEDTMTKDLADITATEQKAIKDFDAVLKAKSKEISANTEAIESKTERLGQVNVDIVNLEEGLDDGTKAMRADRTFLADLGSGCKSKQAEWETRSKTRSQEVLAIAETIKLLNDDDALELFKKTLPSSSFLQMKVTDKAVRQQALRILESTPRQKDPRLNLVMLMLSGHGGGFGKVLKMIDQMVALLGKEQEDDAAKKELCEKELDVSEDHKKELDHAAADLEKEIAVGNENLATLVKEIAALVAGIGALDKSVADATELRKNENTDYKTTMSANKATKELLGVAKNRLNQFYNPALYKAPPKQELAAEQRIAVSMGSEAAPTVAPSGISGTGITYFAQVSMHGVAAPAPPPTTWGAYQKKGQDQAGVTAMIDLLIADVDKDVQEGDVEEKNAQAEYEEFMLDSTNKRAADSESVADKEGTKAELEARLQRAGVEHKSKLMEAYTTATTIKDLHLECDWLLSNFDARKEARTGEVDSLTKAKAVLSGADFS